MNTPGFTAEASLHKAVINYHHKAVWASSTNDPTIIAQRIKLPTSPGCGACTPLTWPNGTPTGACMRDCCDVLGRCSFEACSCGGGGLFGGGWGGVFSRLS